MQTTRHRKTRILTAHGPTKFFAPETGLEQWDSLSPILWNVFYESLLRKLKNSKGYLFHNLNIVSEIELLY